MLIKYDNYTLKQGMQYPFINHQYSELVYMSDKQNSYIFDIVEPTKIITKSVQQLMNAGYLDQINKEATKALFTDPVYRFLYDKEQENYILTILFTLQEKVNFSQEFQSILIKNTYAIVRDYYPDDPEHEYITLENPHKREEDPTMELQTFWMYSITATQQLMDTTI